MLNKIENEKGFTLMEVIISIATLAIISGFILQMFIVSSNVNKKARDLDIGTNMAVNAIEAVKKHDRLESCLKETFYTNSYAEATGDGLRIYKCFDKDWKEIAASQESVQSPQTYGVRFILTMLVTGEGQDHSLEGYKNFSSAESPQTEETTGQLGALQVHIKDAAAAEGKQELVNLDAAKYFYSMQVMR